MPVAVGTLLTMDSSGASGAMAQAPAMLWEDPMITMLRLDGKRIAARNAAYEARRAGDPRGETSYLPMTAAPLAFPASLPTPPRHSLYAASSRPSTSSPAQSRALRA